MNHKETVIQDKPSDLIQCPNCHAEWVVLYHNIREAQAEVSFKAGAEQGYGCGLYTGEAEGYAMGIKEVVEFINALIIGIEGCKFEERLDGDKGCIVLDMNENQWQAQLKEWGIEP